MIQQSYDRKNCSIYSIYIYTYTYTYAERERERERKIEIID